MWPPAQCFLFLDSIYNKSRNISQVYRGWLHSLGTRSAVDLKRYSNISQVYRGLLHSLGTRSAVDILKVFSTSEYINPIEDVSSSGNNRKLNTGLPEYQIIWYYVITHQLSSTQDLSGGQGHTHPQSYGTDLSWGERASSMELKSSSFAPKNVKILVQGKIWAGRGLLSYSESQIVMSVTECFDDASWKGLS